MSIYRDFKGFNYSTTYHLKLLYWGLKFLVILEKVGCNQLHFNYLKNIIKHGFRIYSSDMQVFVWLAFVSWKFGSCPWDLCFVFENIDIISEIRVLSLKMESWLETHNLSLKMQISAWDSHFVLEKQVLTWDLRFVYEMWILL